MTANGFLLNFFAGNPVDGHQVLVRSDLPVQPVDHPARGARRARKLQRPSQLHQENLSLFIFFASNFAHLHFFQHSVKLLATLG